VRELIRRYNIPRDYFREIIAGVAMDIEPAQYRTFEDLRLYCHRVASVVGLASIEIFGYHSPACKQYAANLGLALQLTNILRDVAQDFANGGRIYLPLEEMERFEVSPEDLAAGRYNHQFVMLMEFEAARAVSFYEKAAAGLPAGDRRSMSAAEIMRKVYRRLLQKMQRDRFRVFEKRYSLSRVEKLCAIASVLLRNL
jgi:phytoene synthase